MHLVQNQPVTPAILRYIDSSLSGYENTGPWDPTGNVPYYTRCNVNQAESTNSKAETLASSGKSEWKRSSVQGFAVRSPSHGIIFELLQGEGVHLCRAGILNGGQGQQAGDLNKSNRTLFWEALLVDFSVTVLHGSY